jgi:hypothetical protein
VAYVDAVADYAAEAIPERNPAYELPGDGSADDIQGVMTAADSALWDAMVRRRPLLAHLRTVEATVLGTAERN